MIGDMGLAVVLLAAVVLGVVEIHHWWRPSPNSSPVRHRFQAAPARKRANLRLKPHQVQAFCLSLAAVALFAMLTTNLMLAILLGLGVWGGASLLLPRWQRRRRAEQAREELRVALDQLIVDLRAGESLPTALAEWPGRLARVLGPGRSILVPELQRVRDELRKGATAEEALEDLSERLRLDEMRLLAGVVGLCRRRGGDLEEPMAQAAQMLSDALDVRSQIRTLTAGKRVEGAILTLLPPGMLLLLILAVPDRKSVV